MVSLTSKRLYVSLAAAGLLALGGAGVATASYLPFMQSSSNSASVNADPCATDTADTSATDVQTQDTDTVQNECGDQQSADVAGATGAADTIDSGGSTDATDSANTGDTAAQPGTIDDGKDLLPQAKLSLDQAITAAQAVAIGPVGEIDLEQADSRLVFNVEIGNQDVQIDAADGSVVGTGSD